MCWEEKQVPVLLDYVTLYCVMKFRFGELRDGLKRLRDGFALYVQVYTNRLFREVKWGHDEYI